MYATGAIASRRPNDMLRHIPALSIAKFTGLLILAAAIACFVLAPIIGEALFASIWGVEPLTYIGAALLTIGLAVLLFAFALPQALRRPSKQSQRDMQDWSSVTQQYFELFDHDLGRPLRRILGKERELRAYLRAAENGANGHIDIEEVTELLDEIEMQAPNFRLMMSNIRVLIQLEAPNASLEPQPVEVPEVVRRIIDRYNPVAAEANKSISWWAEPSEFGIVYSDSAAIEHIVTNLVDNAVRFANSQVHVWLTREDDRFSIHVWDDGEGVSSHYRPHVFDRGWTPAVARREEKTSSGLGLYIAYTLSIGYGGDLTIENDTTSGPNDHTTFVLTLPSHQPAPAGATAGEIS
ncbi:MAG: HAMP domain-containing histidine kinase [Chloroflexi bacterium]|nr:HAMP domain-containing histidine kinase [Chloroflexota bacterium]